jgi:hypothetical protein
MLASLKIKLVFREYFKLYKEFGECMMPFFLRGDNVNYL